MAKLNLDTVHFAAAVSAVILSSGRKLSRNFSYYRSGKQSATVIYKDELLYLCKKIRMEMFSMHNLMENPTNRRSPFLVAMAEQINDYFEEIHRKLLFFEATNISNIIPEIDRQRFLWKQYVDEEFYGNNLNNILEVHLPQSIRTIETGIQRLPDSALC